MYTSSGVWTKVWNLEFGKNHNSVCSLLFGVKTTFHDYCNVTFAVISTPAAIHSATLLLDTMAVIYEPLGQLPTFTDMVFTATFVDDVTLAFDAMTEDQLRVRMATYNAAVRECERMCATRNDCVSNWLIVEFKEGDIDLYRFDDYKREFDKVGKYPLIWNAPLPVVAHIEIKEDDEKDDEEAPTEIVTDDNKENVAE